MFSDLNFHSTWQLARPCGRDASEKWLGKEEVSEASVMKDLPRGEGGGEGKTMHLSAKRAMCTLKQENGKLIWGQNKILVKELPGG